MGRSDPPDTSRNPRRPSSAPPTGNERRISLLEVLWSCALVAVPLGAGLVVNAVFGWWPGLGALLVTGVIIGFAAHRADPRRHRR